MTIGVFEILLIFLVILLIVGPRRIADLGRALGRGVQDFKTEFGRDKGNRELPEEEQDNKPHRKS